MAMNYVGNISILDRGDAPAQAVLDRNARTLAKRVADETKEDLAKVMQRVDHVCKALCASMQLRQKCSCTLLKA